MSERALADLYVLLTAHTKEFITNLGEAGAASSLFEGKAHSLQGAALGIGAAAVKGSAVAAAAITGFTAESIHHTEELGHAIYEMTRQFGLTAEQASDWLAAGKQLGLSNDQISTGFKFLGKNMEGLKLLDNAAQMHELEKAMHAHNAAQVEAAKASLATAEASKPLQQAFDQLHVRYKDSHGALRPLNDVMLDVSAAFAKLPDGADKAGIAVKLFGRSGTDLIPILDEGNAGLKELFKKAHDAGVELSGPQVEAAEKAYKAHKQLDLAVSGLTNTVGAMLLPAFTSGVELINANVVPALQGMVEWVGEHSGGAVDALHAAFERTVSFIRNPVIPAIVELAGWFHEHVAPKIGEVASIVRDVLLPKLGELAGSLHDNVLPKVKKLATFFVDDVAGAILSVAREVIPKILGAFKFLADHVGLVEAALGAFVARWAAIKALHIASAVVEMGAAFVRFAGMEGVGKATLALLGFSGTDGLGGAMRQLGAMRKELALTRAEMAALPAVGVGGEAAAGAGAAAAAGIGAEAGAGVGAEAAGAGAAAAAAGAVGPELGVLAVAMAGLVAPAAALTLAWDHLSGGMKAVGAVALTLVTPFAALDFGLLQLVTHLPEAVKAIGGFFKDLPGNIAGFLTGAGHWLKQTGQDIIGGLAWGLGYGVGSVYEFFIHLPGHIEHLFAEAPKWLINAGSWLLHGLGQGVLEWAPNIWRMLGDLAQNIVGFFRDTGHWLRNAGEWLIHGIVQGATDFINTLGSWFNWVKDKFLGGIKSAIGAGSPATEFFSTGHYMVMGIAEGIRQQAGLVQSAMETVVGDVRTGLGAVGINISASGHYQGGTPPGTGVPGAIINGPITIVIHEAEDARATAERVRDELLNMARGSGVPSLLAGYA